MRLNPNTDTGARGPHDWRPYHPCSDPTTCHDVICPCRAIVY
jgi:hypothetical protein